MNQKIIIVEGVDKIGKTTLCGTLEGHLNIHTYKRPSDEFDFSRLVCGGVAQDVIQQLSYLRKKGTHIIFDRLHLSEYVYGKIDRNYDEHDNICWFDAVEDFMQGLDVTLILGRPCSLRWTNEMHGQDVTPYDKCFTKIFEHSRIPKKFEYRWENFEKEYPLIRQLIEKDEVVK